MLREQFFIIFSGVFFSILFLQSSLDKVFNWKSELTFNREHFGKTLLKPIVPLIFSTLTLMEFSSGALSLVGVFSIVHNLNISVSFFASCLCASTLLCLFLGQRIAKDYSGAQSLVSYFILSLFSIYFSFPPLP